MNATAMDTAVREFLTTRQADHPRSLVYYTELWNCYLAADLANSHFVSELTSGSKPKFFQRIWEMLVARHLRACGHAITSRPEGEPDFRFVHDGLVVWVEAVSPSPGPDLSCERPTTTGTYAVPHNEILLRWTTAFDAKWKKGVEYRHKGVVRPEEAYVIAIDGSQLGWFPLAHGASRRPYLVEAAFAMGPVALAFDNEEQKVLGLTPTVRFATANRNQSPVRTEAFLSPDYAAVSAAIGCVPPMFSEPVLDVQVAYNPLADVPVHPGMFGTSAEEWVAKLVGTDAEGQDWDLHRLGSPAAASLSIGVEV